MADITIYHNGQCSKSKGALELLRDSGAPFDVRWYLAEPLSASELQMLLTQLGMNPSQLIRRNEPLFIDKYAGKTLKEDEWLQIMVAEPELIERPIVAKGGKAIIARPPELVLDFIK